MSGAELRGGGGGVKPMMSERCVITAVGVRVVRYTGSELFSDPRACFIYSGAMSKPGTAWYHVAAQCMPQRAMSVLMPLIFTHPQCVHRRSDQYTSVAPPPPPLPPNYSPLQTKYAACFYVVPHFVFYWIFMYS